MRFPPQLIRNDKNAYKNTFGHACFIAGSPRLLGAAALSGLAAMKTGCGLTTLAVPESLNDTLQSKINPVIMTWPLKETIERTIALAAFKSIQKDYENFDVFAIGPGLSRNSSTLRMVQRVVATCPKPLVIDADALWAMSKQWELLNKTKSIKVLTPHIGELAHMMGKTKKYVKENRESIVPKLAKAYKCTVLLKGHKTLIADSKGQTHVNKTGNPGMATAGSGDVLTGIITALLAQGLEPYEAAKFGAHLHGLSGDLAIKKNSPISLIASDLITHIPSALKDLSK